MSLVGWPRHCLSFQQSPHDPSFDPSSGSRRLRGALPNSVGSISFVAFPRTRHRCMPRFKHACAGCSTHSEYIFIWRSIVQKYLFRSRVGRLSLALVVLFLSIGLFVDTRPAPGVVEAAGTSGALFLHKLANATTNDQTDSISVAVDSAAGMHA